MTALIIEDEAPAARRLRQLLTDLDPSLEVVEQIDSVEAAVKWLKLQPMPDLIFMDIELADGQSFEIFKHAKITAPVIFTTAYDEYALRAFKSNGIDYLLKPIDPAELRRSLDKFRALTGSSGKVSQGAIEQLLAGFRRQEYKQRFLVKTGDKLISIDTGEIAYFISEEKLSFIITRNDKKYLADHTLDELEQVLDPRQFFRLNRQVLGHVSAIESIHSYFNGKLKLHLKPGLKQEVLVSREKAGAFKAWLDK